MGIGGLTQYLKRQAPSSIRPVVGAVSSVIGGQLCLVDAAIFMHKFAYAAKGGGPAMVDGFVTMAKGLARAGGKPLFVFDGSELSEKRATRERRARARAKRVTPASNEEQQRQGQHGQGQGHEIGANVEADVNVDDGADAKAGQCLSDETDFEASMNAEVNDDDWLTQHLQALARQAQQQHEPSRKDFPAIMERLRAHNVPYMVAENEAERDCALIARAWPRDALVITQDMDALVFGAPRVLRDLSLCHLAIADGNEAFLPAEAGCFVVDLACALEALGVDMPQFVDACILCGCDFTTSKVRGMGPATAFAAIRRKKTIEQCLGGRPLPADFEFAQARAVFGMPPNLTRASVVVGAETQPLVSWISQVLAPVS